MKINKKTNRMRFMAKVLTLTMIISTFTIGIAGCGKKEVVEDTKTKISVQTDELIPTLTDKDLGIERFKLSELMKIETYQSWMDYDFLVLVPADDSSLQRTVVCVEDKDLYNALYNAKNDVYLNVSYTSVTPEEDLYSCYAKGLRSLGSRFYEFAETKDVAPEETTEESTEETVSEAITETTEETVAEEGTTVEAPVEETKEANSDPTQFNGWEDTEEVKAQKAERAKLQEAVDIYMTTVSLNRATKIIVCDKEGASLGELTADKLNDYLASLEKKPEQYETGNGVVYLSDLKDGIEYTFNACQDENGAFTATFKNDKNIPLKMEVSTDTMLKEIVMFSKYMPTTAQVNADFAEDYWSGSGTDEVYKVTVRFFNSDTDLASSLGEGFVLKIGEEGNGSVTPDQDFESTYDAAINLSDNLVYLKADTGDGVYIQPGEAIGLHKGAYSTMQWSASTEDEAK